MVIVALLVLAGVLWLRWATFDGHLWNVDEAIHAAAARTILDGGMLYHDAIDQRTPLTYYVVAGVFALAGENNMWAVRCFVAGVVAATAFLLYLAGRRLGSGAAGLIAAVLYATLSSTLLFQGDAYAANTEWFVALFSSAGAVALLHALAAPSPRRWFGTGLLSAAPSCRNSRGCSTRPRRWPRCSTPAGGRQHPGATFSGRPARSPRAGWRPFSSSPAGSRCGVR